MEFQKQINVLFPTSESVLDEIVLHGLLEKMHESIKHIKVPEELSKPVEDSGLTGEAV